jgi:hypothetical protein
MLKKIANEKVYMNVNVILSFDSFNDDYLSQERFDLKLSINKYITNAESFIHTQLFKRIAKKCKIYNRRVEDLHKISTCSDWDLFRKITDLKGLDETHICKWYFGNGRDDLDVWEKNIMREFKFGIDVDASWMYSEEGIEQYNNKRFAKIYEYVMNSPN